MSGTDVKIRTAIDSEIWRKDIRNFHVGLVSLSPGGASVCLPSKTYSMMAGGLSIIGICPEWSDLANLIKEMDAGWVVNNSIYSSTSQLKSGEKKRALRAQPFRTTVIETTIIEILFVRIISTNQTGLTQSG